MPHRECILAFNKRAKHDYIVQKRYEAGIVLKGTEVKALRFHKCDIKTAHVVYCKGSLQIYNMHIPVYKYTTHNHHEPNRSRILLLHRKEIREIAKYIAQTGITCIPLKVISNTAGLIKLEIGVCKGTATHDKRRIEAEHEQRREKEQIIKRYRL